MCVVLMIYLTRCTFPASEVLWVWFGERIGAKKKPGTEKVLVGTRLKTQTSVLCVQIIPLVKQTA